MNKGLVHIITGDGKGKTTCAIGLAVRCAGRGNKVAIFQFMKTEDSGEVLFLKDKLDFFHCDEKFGFVFNMNESEKNHVKHSNQRLWKKLISVHKSYDLIVLDEITSACLYGFVEINQVLSLIKEKNFNTEIVMTGRDAQKELIEVSDYATDLKMVKHPFNKHIAGREGIEY